MNYKDLKTPTNSLIGLFTSDHGFDTEIIDKCIICSESDILPDNRYEILLGLIKPFCIKKCLKCNLRWISPRPTEYGYSKLYAYDNYFEGPNTVESYSDVVKLRRYQFIKRIIKIETIINSQTPIKILDVGAATGEFVYEANKRGHRADGIEISEGAREKAKLQYDIDLAEIDIWNISEVEKYDVIHMNHVLEHFQNTSKAIDASYRLLRKGGLLIVEVPQQFDNDLDRIRRFININKKPEFNTYSLHHTYFFSPSNLKKMIESYKFSILSLKTATSDRTPLKPFKMKNFILRILLGIADKIHFGGNIIEVYARKM